MKVTLTTICGTDVHILKGEYPGPRGADRRPRAGRRDRGARPGRDRLRARRSRDRRRHHAVRPVPRLPVRRALAVRARRRRLRGDRRLAVRQHDRRLPGRVRAGARRAGQPREDPGRAHRRGGAALPRHHVDRLLGRRARQRADRRRRRRVRAGADRPVRDGRRAAGRRVAGHRRRQRRRSGSSSRAGWAPTSCSTSRSRTSSRRSSG